MNRVSGGDRRGSLRYAANGTPALIGWTEGDEQRSTLATLIDISLGGFAACVRSFPPQEGPVSLRLATPRSSPWIQATVVETIRKGRFAWTRRLVRARFLEPCPYDFFKAAIEGFSRESQIPDFEADGFSVRDWR